MSQDKIHPELQPLLLPSNGRSGSSWVFVACEPLNYLRWKSDRFTPRKIRMASNPRIVLILSGISHSRASCHMSKHNYRYLLNNSSTIKNIKSQICGNPKPEATRQKTINEENSSGSSSDWSVLSH